ncbi:MAG TPA: 16S rRNA (guanine(527)-N(7))-methyltransferase RsmG [Azospirillaceae bacterium]|nr:16S rRNA (guanine(527)-N(7))-methyltransferase RsmG [Azospirillaceae bacterium]
MTVRSGGAFGPDRFADETGVSRETRDRLAIYAALLAKWNPRINLVAASTLDDVWRRHLLDSAQLHPLLPPRAEVLVDFGSGAGFPGLVLAILGGPHVHLIDSDKRKCAFLREVARETGARVTVHAARIEDVPPFPADVATARALASLDMLVGWAAPFVGRDGQCLFLKGARLDAELTEAARNWTMRVDRIASRTDPSGTIVRLQDIASVERDPA